MNLLNDLFRDEFIQPLVLLIPRAVCDGTNGQIVIMIKVTKESLFYNTPT